MMVFVIAEPMFDICRPMLLNSFEKADACLLATAIAVEYCAVSAVNRTFRTPTIELPATLPLSSDSPAVLAGEHVQHRALLFYRLLTLTDPLQQRAQCG